MPELPEVEAVARALRPLIAGKTIERCQVIHPIATRPSSGRGEKAAAAELERNLPGRKILAVQRRGKYLLLPLDRGTIVLHFRLDGQLIWSDSDDVADHVDVVLRFRQGALGFVDRRHFGRVQWVERPEQIPGIRALGVEPLSREFRAQRLAELLRASRRPLKLFLVDQDKIAGLGNIYSSEALWHARLSPKRLAHRVSPAETRRLHKAIVGTLERALECCLDPAPDFRDSNWWFQGLERILRVYGREGKPCKRCGMRIRRIEQGGRSSFVCASCQK